MGFATEFKKFVMRGNVVDLAIGVIIGAAFGGIVDSLVKDIFMPSMQLLTGNVDVSGFAYEIKDVKDGKEVVKFRLPWGDFVQKVINFVIVAFCLFLVVKAMTRLIKKEEKAAEPTATEKLLAEIRDLLAQGNAPGTATTSILPKP
jgi:large conductance mechanosensitive channel